MGFFDMLLVLRFRLDTTWITSKTILPLRVLCPETASSTLWMLGFLNYPSTFQQILHCAFICVWHKCQRVRHCTFLLLVSEPLHIRSWCYVPYLLKQRPTLHHLSLFDAVSKQFLVPRSFMSTKNPTRSWRYLVSSSSNFPCAPHWKGLMNMCHSQQPRQWKHPFGIRGKQNIGSVVGNKFAIHARRPQAEDKNLRFAIVKFPDAISTCHRSSTPFGHILIAIRGVITIRFSFALGQSRTQKHCGLLKPC